MVLKLLSRVRNKVNLKAQGLLKGPGMDGMSDDQEQGDQQRTESRA
jgi:hypothetical protein